MLRSFILALFLSLPLWGQAQTGNLAWQHAYGSSADETGGFAVAMPGGGYMLLGRQPYFFGQYQWLYFVRTNAQGDTLWTKPLIPRYSSQPTPTGLAVDANGNLLVTANELNSSNGSSYFLKLTPTCDTIWTRTYHPTFPPGITSNSGITQPTIGSDGNYTLIRIDASYTSGLLRNHNSLFKLDANTGRQLWSVNLTRYFAQAGLDSVVTATGFAQIASGALLTVDGYVPHNTAGVQLTLLVNNLGTVSLLKRKNWNYPSDSPPVFVATTDGNVVEVRRQHILKLSYTGDTLWNTVVPQAYQYRTWSARAVVEDATGNLLVAANSQIAPPSQSAFASNVHLVRFSRAGALLNDTLLYRPGDTYARAVVLGPTGGDLVFSGYTTNGLYGGSDLLMARYARFRPLATPPGAALAAGHLSLYPNPAAPGAPVQAELPDPRGGTLRVYDALGRAVGQQPVPAGTGLVPVSAAAGLPAGVYLLRFERADGRCATARLLRE